MEYLNRETRDVPFGWMEALMTLLRRAPKSQPRREPLRLPPPASPVASAR